MSEGWTWGPERSDTAMEHPDLVPYDELSDSEREYDRRTAMESIKAILALGYRISSPDTGDPSRVGGDDDDDGEGDNHQG